MTEGPSLDGFNRSLAEHERWWEPDRTASGRRAVRRPTGDPKVIFVSSDRTVYCLIDGRVEYIRESEYDPVQADVEQVQEAAPAVYGHEAVAPAQYVVPQAQADPVPVPPGYFPGPLAYGYNPAPPQGYAGEPAPSGSVSTTHALEAGINVGVFHAGYRWERTIVRPI